MSVYTPDEAFVHPHIHMKISLTALLIASAFVGFLPFTVHQASAQELPKIPREVLGDLAGYTTSYISGGPYGGSILVIGGIRGGKDYQSRALLYDPNTQELVEPEGATLQLGTKRAYHTATPLADGRILLFGGESAPNSYVSVAELFDPVNFKFVPLSVSGSSLPHSQRKYHAATFFYSLGSSKQYALITGGCTDTCTKPSEELRDSIIFEVEKTSFMAGPVMKSPRLKHVATYLPTAAGLGAVMQMGGDRDDAEYFDIESFTGVAGSGKFVQDASVRQIIADNQFLLKSAILKPNESAIESEDIMSRVPGAISKLLSSDTTKDAPKPKEDTKALEQQLAELNRLQKSITGLRVPGATPRITASDARGRTATSGPTSETGLPAQDTKTPVEGNVAKALIAAQQERVAGMLRGGALGTTWTGSGSIINSIPTEATYATDFSLYLSSVDDNTSAFLRSLNQFSRDSDHDGLSDMAELSMGLHPFAKDSNGDGVMDSDAFLGVLSAGESVSWPINPYYTSACAEGVLFGYSKPGKEVGVFLQEEGAKRTQIVKTTANNQGRFFVGLPESFEAGSYDLVLRVSAENGFSYSPVRGITALDCPGDDGVLLDKISLHEGRRQVTGRAAPMSLVLLDMQGVLLASLANESGLFVMQLPTSLSAGRVDIHTWYVDNGKVSKLQTYPLDIPLNSLPLMSDVGTVRESAGPDDNNAFWWLYTLGILSGVASLCGLAFYTWRRYPISANEQIDSLN